MTCPCLAPPGSQAGWRRVTGDRSVAVEDGFEFDLDSDVLGDQHAAGFKGDVPGDVEVFAVDRGACREDAAVAAPGVAYVALEGDREGDLPGHSVDGEVAVDGAVGSAPVDRVAAERGGGEPRDVEELWGLDVFVACDAAGLDAGHVDGDVDVGVGEAIGDGDRAGHVGEPSADLGDHEVAADESEVGVSWVDVPSTGGRQDVPVNAAGRRGNLAGGGVGHGESSL